MKKYFVVLLCGLMLCGCGKKDQNDSVPPTPTPDVVEKDENPVLNLGEKLPESVKEITLRIETTVDTITIEFKDEEIDAFMNHLKQMKVYEKFDEVSGSGALSYRITYTDDQDNCHEITEQGNVLRLADGQKTGPEGSIGLIHQYVMNMDWVIEISDYEMLTPVRVETEDYVVTCPKGETSIYDLAYLKSVGFDPFESGFTVVVDGTDMVLTEMPTEGDYLLILTKDNASYQLKVTSSVK